MSIHLAVLAELERRSVEKAASELDKKFSQRTVEVGADVKAGEIRAAAEKIKREFSDIRAEIKIDVDKSAATTLRGVSTALNDVERTGRRATSALSDIGKISFQSARGVGVLGLAVAGIPLIDMAKAAVTATQSLYLLPAALSAAGAGMLTLKLATAGFGDAMKDIRDPKKFAEDLAMLSPNAQQAALSLQNLIPLFDQVKNATQDAFFADMGEQINRLATTYAPAIQNMTTTIATAFNDVFKDIGNLLMQPGTQGQLSTIMTNIGAAFQNAAPAARSFAQAFIDIAQVGSQFLPGLGASISEVASNFAAFIRQARDSGQLQVWIQQGIDAVKLLGQAIWDIGTFIYKVFGEDGQQNIEDFKNTLAGVNQVLDMLRGDFSSTSASITDQFQQMSNSSNIWEVGFQQNVQSVRNAFADIPETFQTAANFVIKILNGINHGINYMAENATKALDHILPGDQSKNFTPIPDIPELQVGDWRPASPAPFAPGQHADRNIAGAIPPGKYRTRTGEIRNIPQPGIPNAMGGSPYGGPFAVPGVPPGGPGASDKERRDAIIAGLDPSLYKVDPFAPVPGMPSPGQLAGGPMPGGGYGAASGQDFFEGQQRIIEQAHQLEESRKQRLALERDNEATSEEIGRAKWAEYQDEVALQKAQADLVEKTKGTAKDLKSGMDELGVALDPDFGLSKGLAGLAENLVKFLGNIAAAPMEAKLQAISNASPIQGGYGLFGIRGAQNISQGLSPILGNPLTADQQQAYYGSSTGGGSMGYAPLASGDTGGTGAPPPGQPMPGESARDFAHRVMMPYFQRQGLTVGDHAADKYGEHQNGALDIMVPDIATGQSVLQQVLSDPNVYGAIFNNQTYGYGHGTTPQDYTAGHTGDPSQDHTNHVHAWYKPGGSGNITPGGGASAALPGGGGSYGGFGGSIPIPLPVTIVGMGAGGGGGGAASALGPAALGGGKSLWDAVAQAESSGNWANMDTGGSGHYGGLQFSPETWKVFGGVDLTGLSNPAMATRDQQIAIANRTAFSGYNGTPPQGLGAWEAITSGSVPGVSTATPSSAFMPTWGGSMPGAGGGQAGGPGPTMPIGGGLGGNPSLSQPGIGGGLGANPTQIGGIEPGQANPGGGGVGMTPGGTLDTALGVAASGLDIIAPGAGQAAQMGIKLANRAIQYGGQLAGIGVQGLMETFLPTGASELANNSWLTRIAGGLAGVSPQIPNIAGGKGGQGQGQPPGPLTPQQVQPFGGQTASGQAPITVNYTANGVTEDRGGADVAANLRAQRENQALSGHR